MLRNLRARLRAKPLDGETFTIDPATVLHCEECGQPEGVGHLGTCSHSMMRGGDYAIEAAPVWGLDPADEGVWAMEEDVRSEGVSDG